MNFEIRQDFPPNIDAILNTFNLTKEQIIEKNAVFCYGIVLYNPTGKEIPPHLIEHEKVHQKQQLEMGVELWWDKYLKDKDFRLEQEICAYGTQYKFVKERVNNKIAKNFLTQITMDCCGELYGFDIDYGIIESKIRKFIS